MSSLSYRQSQALLILTQDLERLAAVHRRFCQRYGHISPTHLTNLLTELSEVGLVRRGPPGTRKGWAITSLGEDALDAAYQRAFETPVTRQVGQPRREKPRAPRAVLARLPAGAD